MRNKKVTFCIFLGVFVLLIKCCTLIYMYWDYKNVITVNTGYLPSDDSFMVVNTYEKNNSLWCKIRQNDFPYRGAVISSIDQYGYVQEIVTIKDASIVNAYHLNNHLYVLYYHVSDYYKGNGVAEICRWADFDLDNLNNYTITEYQSGEIKDFDAQKVEPIKRSDLEIHNEQRSNIVVYNDAWYYLDGKNLVTAHNGQYEVIYTFDKKLNRADMYLAGDLLYLVMGDGYLTSTVHVIDLQTLTHNVCYETAKEYKDCIAMDNTLYMLFEQSLISINCDGTVTKITSLDSDSYEGIFQKLLKDAENNIVLLTNQGFQVIDSAGNVIRDARYNSNIVIKTKVMEIEAE